MITRLRTLPLAALGLTLAIAPLAANAAPTGYVRAGGYHAAWTGRPGYGWHAPGYGYYRPAYGYYRPGYGYYRPAFGYYRGAYAYYGPRYPYVNGWYGVSPLGWYGYYWNGGWYHYRRWSAGVWIYF